MRTVELIKFGSEKVQIGDYKEYIEIHGRPSPNTLLPMISDCHEVVYNPRFDVSTLPIKRVIYEGKEHYIAVDNRVWEYIYAIENPVTARSQEKKIRQLKGDVHNWRDCHENTSQLLKILSRKIHCASLWQRIKWVFTGFK